MVIAAFWVDDGLGGHIADCWLLGRSIWLLPLPGMMPEQVESMTTAPTHQPDDRSAVRSQLLDSGVFAHSGQVQATGVSDSQLPLEIHGLVAGTRPPLAVLSYQGERYLLREGDRLNEQLRVVRIDGDQILLDNHGALERVALARADAGLLGDDKQVTEPARKQTSLLPDWQRRALLDDVRLLVLEEHTEPGYQLDSVGQGREFLQALGLENGDYLLRMDHEQVAGLETLERMLQQLAQGETVVMQLQRGGREKTLNLRLETRP